MNERRDSKRVLYLCEVQCEGAGTSHLSARVTDLSLSGAFIDSMVTFPEGSIIRMQFQIRGREFDVSAEVRHSMPRIGMGVQFRDLSPDDRMLLELAIESLS